MKFLANAVIRRGLLCLFFVLGIIPSLLSQSGFDLLRFMRRIPVDERGTGLMVMTHRFEDPLVVEVLEALYAPLGRFGWTDYGSAPFQVLFLILLIGLFCKRKDLGLTKWDYVLMSTLSLPVFFFYGRARHYFSSCIDSFLGLFRTS